MTRVLTTAQAKAYYDWFGSKQDSQSFYENRALATLTAHAGFQHAHAVFEFGCGTGRFAQELLTQFLPTEARYLGIDISETMVGLARQRLAQWNSRASVRHVDGSLPLDLPESSFDRFVSTYVLDLLSAEQMVAVITEAARLLSDSGLLCLVSLTEGRTPVSRFVSGAWAGFHRLRPQLVGGCRPIQILPALAPATWNVAYHTLVTAFGVPSEIVIARRSPRSTL